MGVSPGVELVLWARHDGDSVVANKPERTNVSHAKIAT